MSFSALVTRQTGTGEVSSTVESIDEAALPAGDVLVSVEWAGLNYKDALVLSGKGNLVRAWPHVGGIDFAGRVVESRDARYHPGQPVVLTGWRVGETRWGGYAQRARVDAGMLVPLPKRFSSRSAMMLGTAGLAAMLAVNRLQGEGIKPGDGEVLVTGAGGGVGTIAVMLLARLGYHVAALTGRAELGEQLTRLGASRIVAREDLLTSTGKVLDKETWAGCIDNVGGAVLGEVLKKIRYGGVGAGGRPRRRRDMECQCRPIHPAQRQPVRRRYGDAALRGPTGRLGSAHHVVRPGGLRTPRPRRPPHRPACPCRRDAGWQDCRQGAGQSPRPGNVRSSLWLHPSSALRAPSPTGGEGEH